MLVRYIDIYDCPQTEVYWEIMRADGDIEVYSVLNDTYNYYCDTIHTKHGLHFSKFFYHFYYCKFDMNVIPTDLRYNGAQITGVIDIPECFDMPNVTDTAMLNIQGAIMLLCKDSTDNCPVVFYQSL